ncbi:hypothetical protein L198_05375 [Cryptococcus wingfieldii CBS 7118]|uniref:2-oxoadipate dioxygenase/decarboxylase n=1 Tax=Cryptococcus wingfieldii CBS 7118 TaxID=1295528 RepID=A0A1E3IY12_9TREE|nr:hypothetical protein L198_05375 [Cryptococcus wingfieldii CBS 7118]ODN93510.1 hypothetical protein L198_05375 [Cryptococcus wingfieldii CBS 7118]
MSQFVPPDDLRAAFCTALSNMYRSEVPLYGDLVELVDEVNSKVTTASPGLWEVGGKPSITYPHLELTLADRLRVERHGAIRLGRPCELAMIARLFRLLGMFPVGYYDLSTSGVPVHATAFRPIDPASLDKHPFRVFTSLLRPDLILDEELREQVEEILDARDIFHPEVRVLIAKAEQEGGVRPEDKEQLVEKALETFKWHEAALVTQDVYDRMKRTHPLLADVAGFKGPHINHLTPRVLDIDMVQRMMAERGQYFSIPPKKYIEGPPKRLCPILLRQTSFQALTEPIHFAGSSPGAISSGSHRARFGEIESRGCALTPKGHELYQTLMSKTGGLTPTDDNDKWQSRLSSIFSAFPDSWHILRTQRLAYFRYKVNPLPFNPPECMSLDGLIEAGVVTYVPMVYEDFLPASAAGIFQSNLGEHEQLTGQGNGSAQGELEKHIGAGIVDYCDLYEKAERDSLEEVKRLTGFRLE